MPQPRRPRPGFEEIRGPLTANGPRPGILTPETGVAKSPNVPPRVRARVHLYCQQLGVTLTARHFEPPQVVEERAGGWRLIERPKLEPATDWQGPQALRVELKLLFDGYGIPKRSVQDDLDALRLLGYPDRAIDRPPSIVVVGAVPYSAGGLTRGKEAEPPEWVIEDLSIVEELWTSAGSPCRAVATVKLLKFTPIGASVRKPKKTQARKYTWKAGDTLAEVAKDRLGSAARAQNIRVANPKIKPWSKVKAGTKITIPGIG